MKELGELIVTRHQAEGMLQERLVFVMRNARDLQNEDICNLIKYIDFKIDGCNHFNYKIGELLTKKVLK